MTPEEVAEFKPFDKEEIEAILENYGRLPTQWGWVNDVQRFIAVWYRAETLREAVEKVITNGPGEHWDTDDEGFTTGVVSDCLKCEDAIGILKTALKSFEEAGV